MKRPILLIFANALILLAAFAMLTQVVFVAKLPAVAEKLTGDVEVQRGGRGAFSALSSGGVLESGDVVHSQPGSSVELAWPDGTRLKLMPNTEFTLVNVTRDGLRKTAASRFHLERGKIFGRLARAVEAGSRFEIETPMALASVRGTVFSVETIANRTRVAVYRGSVEIKSSGSARLICADEAALADDTGTIVPARAVDAEFIAEPSISAPSLSVSAKRVGGGAALLSGRTEVGGGLSINGQTIPVLGNGVFSQRVALQPGRNRWVFVATDRHGCTQSLTRSLDAPASLVPAATTRAATTPEHCAIPPVPVNPD